jgi:CopG family nickel-responsive transcriptional regulator
MVVSVQWVIAADQEMQRVTITLDDELMAELDRIIEAKGYQNRSEAIRDLARAGIREAAIQSASAETCVAALVYVYDHSARELSKRLVKSFHNHHDLSLATMHIHLDHETCLEVTVLRGSTAEVQHMGEHVAAERGVRHGRLIMIPVEVENDAHRHGERAAGRHAHIRVK